MIVPLDEVKAALGITDNSEDEMLTGMIDHAAIFIEGQTKRRFDEPILRTEYQNGSGTDVLFLNGHIDIADEDASSADIEVSERFWYSDEWTVLDALEYERRGDSLLRFGRWWEPTAEYKLVYMDGYVDAPIDIRALVKELAIGEYRAENALTDDAAGLTSETLVGVYSYSVSASSAGTAFAAGGDGISSSGQKTLERYKRRFV